MTKNPSIVKSKEEVLIAGAGPTGLTAALALAQKGVKARLIDKRPTAITTSNALGIQPRTLEMWKEMGLVKEALALGHPIKGVMIGTPRRALIKLSVEKLPTPYPFILILPQAKTERLLTEHLSQLGVEIHREVELEELVQYDDRVETVCSGKKEGYSWVVGCDGVHSTVREKAKISFEGEDLPQHFIMSDIHIEWDKPFDYLQVILSHEGPIAFFPFDNSGFGRLVVEVTGDKRFLHGVQPCLEDFQAIMEERYGKKASLSAPSWISSFWIQGRVAKAYRKGRLFLAGDAAHRHSPFGGQGLNTGVQDAYFLAPLLADAVKNGKVDGLEQYEKVRHPIGKQIVKRTSAMTRLMTSRSRPVQSMRNSIMPLLMSLPPIRHKALMTLTQLIYR